MKNILIALALIITYSVWSQNTYNMTLNINNKQSLSEITENIHVYNRYVENEKLIFSSYENMTYNFIDSIVISKGYQLLSFSKDKTEPNTIEKAGGNDCGAAELLCSNSSQTANSGGAGTQELNSMNKGCLSTEHQSSWYYLNIQTGGTLNLTIDPQNNSDDYDFAIWGPFTAATADANCPPITSPIRCSWSAESDQTGLGPYWGQTSLFGCGFLGLSACYGWITPSDNSEGAGGDSWVSTLNVNANEIYILLVDNFSNSGQPYNMSFGGSTVLGCTPVNLPIELLSFTAKNLDEYNQIEWITASEINNDYFTLERSVDGEFWEVINYQKGAGNSTTLQYYKHKDFDIRSEIYYYRLTQYDFNGEGKESFIISVNNLIEEKKIVRIVNTLGQEIKEDHKGLAINIYDDGTTELIYK